MGTLPNFFVIGAQKAGTTSLYHLLQQHPQVFMSATKEPGYFYWVDHADRVRWLDGTVTRPGIGSRDEYLQLFRGVKHEKAIGEASTIYLDNPDVVAHRIKEAVPSAKLLVVLRNPVDRAYSAYNLMRRDGREPLEDFDEALRQEPARISGNFSQNFFYLRRGFYCRPLTAWLRAFPPDRIRVHLFDDLVADPIGVCRDVYRYLGVDDDFRPDLDQQDAVRRNESGIPGSRTVARLRRVLIGSTGASGMLRPVVPLAIRQRMRAGAKRLIGTRGLHRPRELSADSRARLKAIYREDIQSLQGLLGRDLSPWLR